MTWLNQNAAAIQAIGTLIALVIAIWVPLQIHRNEVHTRQREKLYQGQSIALLLEPHLRLLGLAVEDHSIFRREGMQPISVPPVVTDLTKDLWLIGNAGGYVLGLLAALEHHNRILMETVVLPIDMEDVERREYVRLFHERVAIMRENLADALEAMQVLLNRKK